MTDTDSMADNAVRCDSNRASNGNRVSNGNRASNSNRTSDGNRASDSNRASDNNRTSDGNRVSNGMADNGVANSDSDIRVDGSAVVGDLGNVAIGVISMVGDVLDPAVGEVDGVGTVPETGAVVGLGLLEGSARDLVSDTVLVGVGGDLGQIIEADSVGHWVSHSMPHRPGYGVHHRSGHSHRSSNSHAMTN